MRRNDLIFNESFKELLKSKSKKNDSNGFMQLPKENGYEFFYDP